MATAPPARTSHGRAADRPARVRPPRHPVTGPLPSPGLRLLLPLGCRPCPWPVLRLLLPPGFRPARRR
ncbi:hypothetical protein CJI59_26400, partial [Streptomyces sp. Alain-F2R5]